GNFFKEEVAKPEVFRYIPRRFSRYGLPLDQVEARLKQTPVPEAVLITCTMTYWYPGVQAMVELVRKVFGRLPIILGGIYATLFPEHARKNSGADLVISGPAENKILKIMAEVVGSRYLKEEGPEANFAAFDDLPSPAYELYGQPETVCLMTSRGCPFNCSYCASRLIFPAFQARKPEKVVGEIMTFKKTLNIKHVAFYDDALLINKNQHLKKILRMIIENKPNLKFHTPNGLQVRELDEELARLMKEAGFQSIFLSLETADPHLLEKTGPKVKPSDLEQALRYLQAAGFNPAEIYVYLLVGLPEQDKKQVLESVEFVRKLGAKPRLAYFSPVPGTLEWRKLIENGKLQPDSDPLLQNKLVFPYFWSKITPEDLVEIKTALQRKG
ncbi:MAG: B12-binding domain-containing radical SAM protein, partial [Candidatus Aminicenantes bacterium]|nr:B12-binding domain-containing radical SAM protein [Candidatus Aminicenantes bacterium]